MKPAIEGYRERILSFGGPGAGKTRAWLSIADMYRKTRTPGHFYLIDTDDTFYASIAEFPALLEANMVTARYVYDWPSYQAAAKEFGAKAQPNDWVVADLFDKGWEEVQNYYSEQVYGTDKGDFFLAMRKQVEDMKKQKNFQPFEGWTDWPTIKALHAGWANDVIFRHKAHVFLATGLKPVDRKTDNKDTTDTFAHVGAKPGGEKGLAVHGVNTVLLFKQRKAGEEWSIDTAKDRGGRDTLMSTQLKDFALDYLVKVAKWSLAN